MKVHGRAALVTLIAAMVFALSLPAGASAAYEAASSKKWPWTGYWWPTYSGYLNLYDDGEALEKYDEYIKAETGTAGTSQEWEKDAQDGHFTNDAGATWWGHCHAWAAAAIRTQEPPASRTRGGVSFDTDNLRGLVTELYYQPKYSWLAGRRANTDDPTTAAYKDIEPAWFDYLLRYYIGYYRYPFIMDVNADSQVWNFPAFAYARTTTPQGDGSTKVSTRVWYASTKSNVTGTRYWSKVYTYTLKSGTLGSWTGNSVDDHPDFAWLPTGKYSSAETSKVNPGISEARVEEIIGGGYNA